MLGVGYDRKNKDDNRGLRSWKVFNVCVMRL